MSAEKVFLKGNMAKVAKEWNDNEGELHGAGLMDMTSRFLEKTVNPKLKQLVKDQALEKARSKSAPPKAHTKMESVKSTLHVKAKQVPHKASSGTVPANTEGQTTTRVAEVAEVAPTAKVVPKISKEKEMSKPETVKEVEKTMTKTVSFVEKAIEIAPEPIKEEFVELSNAIETIMTFAVPEPVDEEEEEEADSESVEDDPTNDKPGSTPLLCRTGTKKDIAWWLIARFDPVYRKKYVEAFFGGGAIFWAKPKAGKEVINEWNPLIYDFYQRMKRGYSTSPDLMPELTNYDKSMKAFGGKDKWCAELYKYYGQSYISGTKMSKDQITQVDRIARIIIPFLKNNPIITKVVEDKAGAKYDVIEKSKNGGDIDNLVCLYWYILSFCNGMGGVANISMKDLQCLAEKPDNLVKMTANGKPTMPIKKPTNPFDKLSLEATTKKKGAIGRGKWFIDRLQGVDIYNDDANKICPMEDSAKTFFMLDPPYESGGGYGITTTTVEEDGGAKKGKPKEKKPPKPKAVKGLNESVFPFRRFVTMCNNLKGKWMVTINGSKNILELFQGKDDTVKITKPIYATKIWVKNKGKLDKAGLGSFRYEMVYANYKYKDSEDVNDKAFITAPEYMILSNKTVIPITYTKEVQPTQDYNEVEGNKVNGVPSGTRLKTKNESNPDKPPIAHPCVPTPTRKPPISNNILPLIGENGEAPKATAPSAVAEPEAPKRKTRAKKVAEPVIEAPPVNEIISTAPAPKAKRTYVRKAKVEAPVDGEGRLHGGYYSPNRPMFHGGKMAYAPNIVYGGSEYDSGQW